MSFRSGFVAIVGRPNAGKSTLLNRLIGRKVAIVTPKPQTTRNRILGILNLDEAQIVFIDTPGIHKPADQLGRQMMREVGSAVEGIDLVLLIVDASVPFGGGDRFVLEYLKRLELPVILLLNKIDLVEKTTLLPLIDLYQKEHNFVEVIPISAATGDGVDRLLEAVLQRLPEGEPYFPADQYTDQPERFLAAEIIREKAVLATREEIPHAIAVVVEKFEEKEKLLRVQATIYVEREGQKAIVIGKGGAMLKRIGTEARQELELLFGVRVFLELFVKVRRGWREDRAAVRELDWRHQLERMGSE